ncbi:ATP-binding protein [Cyanothece sp. BG0011]|uniref:ATP-binding protein n=1 Tax=Cyanothece sp. BG0011 TaxID=2082950 RepID=UPI000D1DFD5B|nr:MoxR family ATPase [Cyanothece sp. BG0011]
MTPTALKTYLESLVTHNLYISTMIWGAPGIGKSSIVSQVAQNNQLEFIDLRLSQLAPTDLRGLPVAIAETNNSPQGLSTWYPPEFLPREGKGILFLDELNMAPPAMQGVAQQLILDRQVGAYQVPEGWFIWAAGNRKEDRASVFAMPSPLANRFLHLNVAVDFESFKAYALLNDFHEQIIAFLSYRTPLLHHLDPQNAAWPSPRSWEMASSLHQVNLDIAPAVGEAATAEFNAFVSLYKNLPDLSEILAGNGQHIAFSSEPSVRYATTIGLTVRAKDVNEAYNGFRWLTDKATAEWVQLYATDLFRQLRVKGQLGKLAQLVQKDSKLKQFFKDYQELMGLL